jgi:hypothetical protein
MSRLELGDKILQMFKKNQQDKNITLFFRNETSLVSLKFLENGKRIQEVVYSHSYTLRAEISRHDGKINNFLFLLLTIYKYNYSQ